MVAANPWIAVSGSSAKLFGIVQAAVARRVSHGVGAIVDVTVEAEETVGLSFFGELGAGS